MFLYSSTLNGAINLEKLGAVTQVTNTGVHCKSGPWGTEIQAIPGRI